MENRIRMVSDADKLKKSQTRSAIVSDILFSKWSLSIANTLQQDKLRYSAIEKGLPEITQKVLVETLRKLERNGIVHRYVYATIPPQVEYKLTSLGLDLLKLSDTLTNWMDIHEDEIKRARKAYDRRKNA